MDEVEELIHLLENLDAQESRYAARRLSELNDTRALAAMRHALLEPDQDRGVQITIAWALANMAKAIPATAEAIIPDLLRSIARDKQYHKNPIALGPLLEIGVDAIPELIKYAHENKSYDSDLIALDLIRRIDPENPEIASEITRILFEMLGAGDRRVWERAAVRFGGLRLDDQQFEAILGMLDDPDCKNRGQGAMMALDALKDARAIPALTRKLRNAIADPETNAAKELDNWNAGIDAAKALASIGKANPEHMARIAAALQDALDCRSANVRFFVVRDLREMGVPAVPALAWALINDDSKVRLYAYEALVHTATGCGGMETLTLFEGKLKEGAALLVKGCKSRDDAKDAIGKMAELMGKVAARKNELAGKAMENDGLMLAGERPKPPKGGGMYREIGGMKRAVRHG